ncbi:guanylate kinase [Chloroflexota bacterium]
MKKSGCEAEEPLSTADNPLLLILSGPSGAGKDAVLCGLKETEIPLEFITTVTTRPKRPTEKDNVDEHFISEANFQQMVKQGELLEWANVYGNWYGVPRQAVKKALAAGRDVVIKVDIQGSDSIKKALPQAVSIFLAAPSIQELTDRLRQRNTESKTDLDLRMQTAVEEMKKQHTFDHIVVNQQQQLDSVVSNITGIIKAEKQKKTPHRYKL